MFGMFLLEDPCWTSIKIPAAIGLDGVIMLHKMFHKVVQKALRQSKNCIHAYTHEHVRIHIIH